MLICSTGDDGTSVVAGSTTSPAVGLYKGKGCTEALKAILDADQVIVDIEHSERRVIYTAVNRTAAQDFNVSRSNKDKG
jgi:hypothetical protein